MAKSAFTNPPDRAPAQASAYVTSVLALLGGRDPMDVLPRLVLDIRQVIRGLKPAALATPEAPGKWSITQVIGHLADSDIALGWRLRVVLAQDRPPIAPYDQDAWVSRCGAAYPDLESALRTLEVLRAGHVTLLRTLTPEQWDREGIHAERGPESVRRMAELYAGHDLVHLNQIARIKKSLS